MDLGLTGKHAIVTGGSLGIGKAIARELAREGADVAVVARTKDTLEASAREIAAATADVTSRAQVDAMVAQAVDQLGGLHILVNSGSPPGGSATATGPIETAKCPQTPPADCHPDPGRTACDVQRPGQWAVRAD